MTIVLSLGEEDFSGVEVDGQEVFMEGSNEEFDAWRDEDRTKQAIFICLHTEGYCIDFQLPQKGHIAPGYRLSSSQFSNS